VGPKRLGMRLVLTGPSLVALALRLSVLGVPLAPVLPIMAKAAPPRSQTADIPLIYHKGRNFRIPFKLSAETRDRVKEVHLLVSEDLGYQWQRKSKTYPDHPTFTFRSSHDGEYWFAVQTLTLDSKVSPPLDAVVEPNMKVVVDTFPPSLMLEPDDRRGSLASVHWEVKDEHLDLKSLVLEYQVEGVGVWRRVPIRQAKPIGAQSWDAGTAEALKVRASVADRAGNVTEAVIDLPEGTASQSDLASNDSTDTSPLSIDKISTGAQPEITAGPGFTPLNDDPVLTRRPSTVRPSRLRARPNENEEGVRGSQPAGPGLDRGTRSIPATAAEGSTTDLFAMANGNDSAEGISTPSAGVSAAPTPNPSFKPISTPNPPGNSAQPSGRDGGGTLLVPSPRFKLQYAVDDPGPNGPATLELWITQDGGRTWIRRGDDPDRVSPIDVDLGGEGTFGICLVARSASGLGDQPPAPNDPPQSWVEVDSTPPIIQLKPPQVGIGVNSGKVAIAWRASDLHLAPKSVSLFWRPDQPGAGWQPLADGQENVGQFVWTVPASAPPRFHLKVDAVDTLGHHGIAETTDMGPIVVDRSRPRSRIIGLDSNARAGFGPTARPLR
jgi:hypothetical protein